LGFHDLVTGELKSGLSFVEMNHPFVIEPEIFTSLDNGILDFFEKEFGFEIECYFLIAIDLFF
jgi:hypothetical protein